MKKTLLMLISLLTITTSCATPTMRDKVEGCTFRLIEQQGIAPVEAQDACKRLYYERLRKDAREARYIEPRGILSDKTK